MIQFSLIYSSTEYSLDQLICWRLFVQCDYLPLVVSTDFHWCYRTRSSSIVGFGPTERRAIGLLGPVGRKPHYTLSMGESWNEGVRGTQVPALINADAATIRCVAGPGSGKTFGL